jgi:hypothetical protein
MKWEIDSIFFLINFVTRFVFRVLVEKAQFLVVSCRGDSLRNKTPLALVVLFTVRGRCVPALPVVVLANKYWIALPGLQAGLKGPWRLTSCSKAVLRV